MTGAGAATLDQFALWSGLLGGLALFLFGLDLMTGALKRTAGDRMRTLLGKVTRNRLAGVAVGALVTGIVNSSSVTTVILVGFISAGMLSMAQSVSIIMGANIGSTVTAQILAFNVTRFALPLVTLGFLVAFLSKDEDRQDYGRILLGAGLVFYGMGVMSTAMAPLRLYPPFVTFLGSLDSPLPAVLAGAVFTAVVQSSAATTGLVIVLAGQGLMTLETAIAVTLGANIGTCATAGLAAIGKPREAVRAAVVHVLFNVVGVLIWIGFIPELAELARSVSPGVAGPAGAGHAAADLPRQVANAHTIFNVANTLLLVGFTAQIARLVERLVPDRPLSAEEPLAPKFLDESLLSTPAMALHSARFELGRMGDYVADMLDRALPPVLSDSRSALTALAALDKPVDRLHRALLDYLGRISLGSLSSEQADNLMQLVEVANDLEHVADTIATDMVTSARKRIDERGSVVPDAAKRIGLYHAQVARALRQAVRAVVEEDVEAAASVRGMKREVTEIAHEISRDRFRTLPRGPHGPGGPGATVTGYVREVELLEILDGVFKIARRIARSQIPHADKAAQPA
ncbi:phosphate:Na+ symporter [Tistlia consotensis]|uniref:Phosphate:Na+ symporter n=1 Tax=Tistlia consotensis USBA 355 TaxID=560819 RepID=A0A1Y6BH50_9PROT|nr:Na/Pi cotransporter family protein [Tistlia consotensis]SMF11449.1 phosphate:Na+ symporter [Tistlia consotensis USBA 355]SNR51975.1 phosphate:Na+ symporter [Tistlia consotensis]